MTSDAVMLFARSFLERSQPSNLHCVIYLRMEIVNRCKAVEKVQWIRHKHNISA